MAVAAVISRGNIENICFRSDIDLSLQDLNLPDVPLELGMSEEKVLQRVLKEPAMPQQLLSEVDFSESTLYRVFSRLEDKTFIARKDSGKYKITGLGKIVSQKGDL